MKKYYFVTGLLFVFFAYFSYQIYAETRPLQVAFLDVGQGDSILIQKGTRQILIDGGPSGKTEMAKLGKYLPYFDREIEIMIATHPDKDHIAGLIDAARNYKIGKVLATAAEKDTQTFKEWKDVLSYNKIETLEVWRGTEIKFNDERMKIIYPTEKVDPNVGEANDKSIVARLDYGSPPHQKKDAECDDEESKSQNFWCGGRNSFLFTGDIESGAEKEILESGENIDIDFLKVAHHGSKYSSSEEFLDAANPEQAVISVSATNSYGHPTEAVLEALRKRNVEILRTDERGDIIYECKNQKSKCSPALNCDKNKSVCEIRH